MDALEKAVAYAKSGDEEEAWDIYSTLTAANMALAYAAIAQAEAAQRQAVAMERIAGALENISGAYSIDLPARSA